MTETARKKVFLYTSEIAAYIGQNKYDFVTPFERLWKRCDQTSYQQIIEDSRSKINLLYLDVKVHEQREESLKNDLEQKRITKRQYNKQIKELIQAKDTIINNIDVLETKIDKIDLNQEQRLTKIIGKEQIEQLQSDKIETDTKRETINTLLDNMNLTDSKLKELKSETQNFINKTHGTLKEDSAIEIYEKKFGVKLDVSQKFQKTRLNIKSLSEFDWYIGGKVDGLYIDNENPKNSYVVEVKNRTRGFFNTLRDYEKTQIQLYIYMLDLPCAKLVEKYNENIRITLVYRDQEYIDNIIEYLTIFVTNFENKFLHNVDLKTEFVNSDNDQKQRILRKVYLNDITKAVNNHIEEKYKDQDCLIDDLD